MRVLSVCSGIEAASVAWNPLGWKAAAFAEIEKFPSAVLAHHYPDVPNLGDMTRFQEWPDLGSIDLVCGGTPCQSFSVAGLRKGLDDPRGNLMLTFGAIAAKHRPRWLVWENVPGVLSSNGGRDFGAFLGLLGVLGYGFAYRVLDAQYAGLAQRRKRVFVVGCLGDWRSAAAVLFERHSLSGHPAPSRQARQAIAGSLGAGSKRSGGRVGRREAAAGHLQAFEVANCLTARMGKGINSSVDEGQTPVIAHALTAGGFDASEDGTGRGTPLVPIAYDILGTPATVGARETDVHCALRSRAPGASEASTTTVVAFDTTQMTSQANRSNPKAGDPCHPLAAGAHPPAIAFGWQNSSAQGASASEHHSPTLDKSKTPAVSLGMAVRRLTPAECEALQGFPRGYTLIPYRGRPAADGPRYKALGNSWAVPVVRWIGERIEAVDAITRERMAA